jgi:hypothetical protein
LSDPSKAVENAIKALQEELREQREATTYALSLIVLLAKELGLEKKRFAELSREAMKNLPRDLETQEFRKLMRDLEKDEE